MVTEPIVARRQVDRDDRIETVVSDPCATGASNSTGNAVQRREGAPAVPPSNPETVIEWAPHPFTPFDQRRSQIVVMGSGSRFVNVMDSTPCQT